jgi:hypothetical protein
MWVSTRDTSTVKEANETGCGNGGKCCSDSTHHTICSSANSGATDNLANHNMTVTDHEVTLSQLQRLSQQFDARATATITKDVPGRRSASSSGARWSRCR